MVKVSELASVGQKFGLLHVTESHKTDPEEVHTIGNKLAFHIPGEQ